MGDTYKLRYKARTLAGTGQLRHLQGKEVKKYLRISKIQDFVQQLVDQDEVVLDVFLGNFAEIISHDLDDLVGELEYEGGIDILLGHGGDPNVDALHVKEARTRDVRHRRTNLLTRVNHVNAKCCDGSRQGERN